MMLSEEQLIRECKNHNSKAQKLLYEKYAPILRGLCIRYAKDKSESKDILQEGFIKIFTNIRQYSGKGSFEGWMKRIIINTAITYFHKNSKHANHYNMDDLKEINIEDVYHQQEKEQPYKDVDKRDLNIKNPNISFIQQAEFSEEELLLALNILPELFRIVFNLHIIENFKHKEIAEMLKIDENTSRTRLLRARNLVQQHLFKLSIEKLGK